MSGYLCHIGCCEECRGLFNCYYYEISLDGLHKARNISDRKVCFLLMVPLTSSCHLLRFYSVECEMAEWGALFSEDKAAGA